jgi:hypothetical protein
MAAGVLCVHVVILLTYFKTVSLLNHMIFMYVFYLKYTVTSYYVYFDVLLKQTSDMKEQPIPHFTQFRSSHSVISLMDPKSTVSFSGTNYSGNFYLNFSANYVLLHRSHSAVQPTAAV